MKRASIVFPRALAGLRARSVASSGVGHVSKPGEHGTDDRMDPRRDLMRRAEEAHASRLALSKALTRACNAIDIEDRLDGARDFLIELGFGLAAQVLDHELDRGVYDIASAVRSCLEAAFERSKVLRVRVHEADLDQLRGLVAEVQNTLGETHDIRVEPWPGIQRGACEVVTDVGNIVHDPRAMLAESIERIVQGLHS